jgi:hypothetical protein
MKFTFSKHALEQMELRKIPKEIVLQILNKPEQITEEDGNKIYQSIVKQKGEANYLIRIFVNDKKNPKVVITVYKTSKIKKYYEG